MSSPVNHGPAYGLDDEEEGPQRRPSLPSYNINQRNHSYKSSDEDQTVIGDNHDVAPPSPQNYRNAFPSRPRADSHATVETEQDYAAGHMLTATTSSRDREESHRLDDDLKMLQIERQVSRIEEEKENELNVTASNISRDRARARREDDVDEFHASTNPVHETTQTYSSPAHPATVAGKFIKSVHKSSWLIRNLVYATPVVLILLIPLLLGALLFKSTSVGGVQLSWFMIWMEIVWLVLFAARLIAKCLPWPLGVIAGLFSNNAKKFSDLGKQLELPATLFFWGLGVEISFLPTMQNHQLSGSTNIQPWMTTMNKVLVSLLVGVVLNFVEKILIQIIAISFHQRTYQDRIELSKFQIASLTKLYTFSKNNISMADHEFEIPSGVASGTRTPGVIFNEAQKQTKEVMSKFADSAGKIMGDFAGKKVKQSTHPYQVVLALLNSNAGSQVLARRLYRTFAHEDTETFKEEDLTAAFDDNAEETAAAFSMFDKDLNGDISMSELESVCVEIGRERKAITASLKDLDSVVSKLNSVFVFIVAVVVILVFISLISASAAGALTSAGSSILALSWLFSLSAQELLSSIIFIFVKHPFDVGDRVTIYGQSGNLFKGDDYFVKSISLLYTEFKRMTGEVCQASNSVLTNLFVLNHRRSGGLAEAISVEMKFGTTLDQIENLRLRLLEFVKTEKREYQSSILTELREIDSVHAIRANVIFFYKSNWQNEGLRLLRRHKFIAALMVSMQELGIEGPRMRYPGQKESFPVYLQSIPHNASSTGHGGSPDHPEGWQEEDPSTQTGQAPAPSGGSDLPANVQTPALPRHASIRGHRSSIRRPRDPSTAHDNRRVDFSLGMTAADMDGDMPDPPRLRVPVTFTEASQSRERGEGRSTSIDRPSHSINRSMSTASRNHDHDTDRTPSTNNHAQAGLLTRRSTDSDRSRLPTHRNRFFSRHRAGSSATNNTDEASLMEAGAKTMADIPEHEAQDHAPLRNASIRLREQISRGSLARVPSGQSFAPSSPIDPRTGLVSSTAWRSRDGQESQMGDGDLGNNALSGPRPSVVIPEEAVEDATPTKEPAMSPLRPIMSYETNNSHPLANSISGQSSSDIEMRKMK